MARGRVKETSKGKAWVTTTACLLRFGVRVGITIGWSSLLMPLFALSYVTGFTILIEVNGSKFHKSKELAISVCISPILVSMRNKGN